MEQQNNNINNTNEEITQYIDKIESLEKVCDNLESDYLNYLNKFEKRRKLIDIHAISILPFHSVFKNGNPNLWIKHYEVLANLRKWSEEEKCLYLPFYLREDAERRMSPHFETNWQRLKMIFLNECGQESRIQEKYESLVFSGYKSNISKFIDEKIELGQLCNIDDKTIIKDVIENSELPFKYMYFLMCRNLKKVSELKDIKYAIYNCDNCEKDDSEIKGPIFPEDLPKPAKFYSTIDNKHSILCKLVSGTLYSIMDLSLVKLLNMEYKSEENILEVSYETVKSIGWFITRVTVGRINSDVKFYVIEGKKLPNEIIGGLNFIYQFQISIDKNLKMFQHIEESVTEIEKVYTEW